MFDKVSEHRGPDRLTHEIHHNVVFVWAEAEMRIQGHVVDMELQEAKVGVGKVGVREVGVQKVRVRKMGVRKVGVREVVEEGKDAMRGTSPSSYHCGQQGNTRGPAENPCPHGTASHSSLPPEQEWALVTKESPQATGYRGWKKNVVKHQESQLHRQPLHREEAQCLLV